MKVLKKAIQKNVLLNKDFYNDGDIKFYLSLRKDVCFFDEHFNECYSYTKYVENFRSPILRLFLEDGDKLEVQLNYGFYTNVLVKSDGSKYFVIL